jgi:protein-tyrosine phosphatase
MEASVRIPVPGTYNFRDMGGFVSTGGVVRDGVLFRSDGLQGLGEAGRERLSELGVGVIIDLRDEYEANAMPDDIDGLDVTVRRLPVFEGSGASQGATGIALDALYARVVSQHAGVVLEALREIANADRPVVVHCTAGKDRTGIVIALALLAVGVDRDAVTDDYAATEGYLAGEWLDAMVETVARYGVPDTPELRVLMGGSPREALDATIDRIEREHGSVREYLLANGMTLGELAELEHALVEPQG